MVGVIAESNDFSHVTVLAWARAGAVLLNAGSGDSSLVDTFVVCVFSTVVVSSFTILSW